MVGWEMFLPIRLDPRVEPKLDDLMGWESTGPNKPVLLTDYFCQSPPSQVAMQVPSGASKTWIPKSCNQLIIFILLNTDYFTRAKKTLAIVM